MRLELIDMGLGVAQWMSALIGQLGGEDQSSINGWGRHYGREVLGDELSLLTGTVLCSRPHFIRLDGMKKGRAAPQSMLSHHDVWGVGRPFEPLHPKI